MYKKVALTVLFLGVKIYCSEGDGKSTPPPEELPRTVPIPRLNLKEMQSRVRGQSESPKSPKTSPVRPELVGLKNYQHNTRRSP